MSSLPQTGVPARAQINWHELESILLGAVRDATTADAIDGVAPLAVIEPENEQDLAKAVSWANQAGVSLAPRGNGTKLNWGNTPRTLDAIVSTKRLDQVVEHPWADMTATVQAGCTVGALQRTLTEHGQRLAIDPLFPDRTTIGGLIATNDSGSLRLRYGGVRDLIIGITVALPDGTLARSGGKVVKNVAGYDLQKLMTGAFGTLGIITQATFRLHPLPHESESLTFACTDAATANRFVLAILDSTLVPTGLQLRTGSEYLFVVDIRLDGIRAGIESQRSVLQQLATKLQVVSETGDVWQTREQLFTGSGKSLVLKLSVLPGKFALLSEAMLQLCSSPRLSWQIVAQGTGLCAARIDASDPFQLPFALNGIRSAAASLGGTAVVQSCPPEIKKQIDVWGPTVDAQPLMLRIKQQFDPRGILNRGRFVGGI